MAAFRVLSSQAVAFASIPLLRNRMLACVARRRSDCPRAKRPRATAGVRHESWGQPVDRLWKV